MPEDTLATAAAATPAYAWRSAGVVEFLTAAARSIGVGTNTDAGWIPPAPPGMKPIAMTGGIPDPVTLPRRELLAALAKVLETDGEDALRYGGTQGYDGLRSALAESIGRMEGIELDP